MSIDASPEAIQHLLQLATGHIVASAVNVAAELGIADRLAGGPRSAADLARDCGANEDALYRLLRALASVGVFEEVAPRTFALTPTAAALQEGPLRWFARWIASPFVFQVYANMEHSVRSGESAVPATTGQGVFEYFARTPAIAKIFNDAMTGMSELAIPAVLDAYDFGDIATLVDIAGGHGAVLTAILKRYPTMRGILFDIDHVIAGAAPVIAAQGVGDRLQTVSGDFFAAVPSGGEAYIMKHIIHDWDDARATRILQNIRTVLPPRGRVILIEAVIPPGNDPGFGKILDIEMLVMPGGRERTAEEFRALFAGAGFTLTRIVPTRSPLSVVEAKPA